MFFWCDMESLSPGQKLVLENIIESNRLLTEVAADGIEKSADGVGVAGAGGVVYGGAAVLGVAAPATLPVAAIVAVVAGGVLILTGAAYGGFSIWREAENKKIRGKELADYIKDLEGSVWKIYFKEEFVADRVRKSMEDYFVFKRDHEAIESYIKYRTETIAEIEDLKDPNVAIKMMNYNAAMEKYIKPEHILNCHKDLRIWCAYNKVGEFTEKNSGWHSEIWYQRETLKKKMFNCFKPEIKFKRSNDGDFLKDKNGKNIRTSDSDRLKEFNIIKDKFYRITNAKEYLTHEGVQENVFEELTADLNKIMSDRIDPLKRKEFDLLFRKYRYLGNRAEFDREIILNVRFYNEMYAYAIKSWNRASNGSLAGNLVERGVKKAGQAFAITFAAEIALMVAGFYGAEVVACAQGSGPACEVAFIGAAAVLGPMSPVALLPIAACA